MSYSTITQVTNSNRIELSVLLADNYGVGTTRSIDGAFLVFSSDVGDMARRGRAPHYITATSLREQFVIIMTNVHSCKYFVIPDLPLPSTCFIFPKDPMIPGLRQAVSGYNEGYTWTDLSLGDVEADCFKRLPVEAAFSSFHPAYKLLLKVCKKYRVNLLNRDEVLDVEKRVYRNAKLIKLQGFVRVTKLKSEMISFASVLALKYPHIKVDLHDGIFNDFYVPIGNYASTSSYTKWERDVGAYNRIWSVLFAKVTKRPNSLTTTIREEVSRKLIGHSNVTVDPSGHFQNLLNLSEFGLVSIEGVLAGIDENVITSLAPKLIVVPRMFNCFKLTRECRYFPFEKFKDIEPSTLELKIEKYRGLLKYHLSQGFTVLTDVCFLDEKDGYLKPDLILAEESCPRPISSNLAYLDLDAANALKIPNRPPEKFQAVMTWLMRPSSQIGQWFGYVSSEDCRTLWHSYLDYQIAFEIAQRSDCGFGLSEMTIRVVRTRLAEIFRFQESRESGRFARNYRPNK
jgi:hypothetical protein